MMSSNNNPETRDYGFLDTPPTPSTADSQVKVSESRAIAEVQASFVIAKKFPRSDAEAFARIMKACDRPVMAEQAMYAYPRGGKLVEGSSIRLAEVMLQGWGNCEAGVREISQNDGVSVCEAFAIDYETNTRVSKTFHVAHVRDTKAGSKRLTEQRDIYELVANNGARRMRACILSIIPKDVEEAAVERCKATMIKGIDNVTMADRIRKIVLFFDEIGVKTSHLEARLGHNIDAIVPQEIVTLTQIFKSIRDGMASREDYFDLGGSSQASETIEALTANKKKPKLDEKQIDAKTGEVMSQ